MFTIKMPNINQQTGIYTPYNIAFTADNIKHLCFGHPTVISSKQCGKGGLVHLSKRHMAAIQKGMHTGGHITLHKFSKHQMTHNIRGGGWFSSLIDKGKAVLKKIAPGLLGKAKDVIGNLAQRGIEHVGKKATDFAHEAVNQGIAEASKYIGNDKAKKLEQLAHNAVNSASDKAHSFAKGKASDLINTGHAIASNIVGHGIRRGCCGVKGCRGAKCGLWPARQGGKLRRKRGGKLYTAASPTEYDRFDPVNKRTFGKGRKASVSTGKSILNESGW